MQKIFKGIEHLGEALEGAAKVFLVCDSSFPFLNIKEDIEGIALHYTIFDDFTREFPQYNICSNIHNYQFIRSTSLSFCLAS